MLGVATHMFQSYIPLRIDPARVIPKTDGLLTVSFPGGAPLLIQPDSIDSPGCFMVQLRATATSIRFFLTSHIYISTIHIIQT